MREYFATFDSGDKGYVTLEDLRRVRDEVGEAESEMTDAAIGPAGVAMATSLSGMPPSGR